MHKSKHKTKSSTDIKWPQPIKVKKEKPDEERQPMSHYIDDRLELVKQIFGSLKPKTIINLAPDFLKNKSMHKIEELCLNELLCISTKRLRSIIDATKCPTDTESSSDSDVERKEEHVSLEEISSDSEIEGGKSGGKKKKVDATKKDTKQNADKKPENDGQISVLELLELQARARAIRSQLALEPVTKIEVKSDGEKSDKESQSSSKKKNRKRKSSEREASSSKSGTTSIATVATTTRANISETTKTATPPAKVQPTTSTTRTIEGEKNDGKEEQPSKKTKKIKLKRNFGRQLSTREENVNEKEKQIEEPEKNAPNTTAEKDNNNKTDDRVEVKTEKKSRSMTPDVIPVVAEPITLLISDSSDEEEQQQRRQQIRQKNSREQKERKEKNSIQEKAIDDKVTKKRNTEEKNNKEKNNKEQPTEVPQKKARKASLPEDGEVTDSEGDEKQSSANGNNEKSTKTIDTTAVETAGKKLDEAATKSAEDDKEIGKSPKEIEKTAAVDCEEATTSHAQKSPQSTASEFASASVPGEAYKSQEATPNVNDHSPTNEDSNSQSQLTSEQGNSNSFANDNEMETYDNKNSDHNKNVASQHDHDHDDDDDNDDVISLEGGDLEKEMIGHLSDDIETEIAEEAEAEEEKKQKEEEEKKQKQQIIDEDIISLDSTDDERNKDDESWHSRYMRSTKVSKVLAASRLGKRVRDKLKKSKRSKKESERKPSPRSDEERFTSKHEDGSVEQYKELLEMRQRKKKK